MTEGGSMQQPSSEFVREVEAHMEQALQEGWVAAKNTATTLAVGVGVLLAHIEAVADPTTARTVKRLVLSAVGAL